jgi:hypothetical protein
MCGMGFSHTYPIRPRGRIIAVPIHPGAHAGLLHHCSRCKHIIRTSFINTSSYVTITQCHGGGGDPSTPSFSLVRHARSLGVHLGQTCITALCPWGYQVLCRNAGSACKGYNALRKRYHSGYDSYNMQVMDARDNPGEEGHAPSAYLARAEGPST